MGPVLGTAGAVAGSMDRVSRAVPASRQCVAGKKGSTNPFAILDAAKCVGTPATGQARDLPLLGGDRHLRWLRKAVSEVQRRAERREADLIAAQYLADPKRDCEEELSEQLIEDCGSRGSIVVYSSFAKTRINGLAARFPKLSSKLLKLKERLFDLLEVIRDGYYHPGFGRIARSRSCCRFWCLNFVMTTLPLETGILPSLDFLGRRWDDAQQTSWCSCVRICWRIASRTRSQWFGCMTFCWPWLARDNDYAL